MLVAGLLTAPAHARAAEPVPDGAAVDQFDAGALGPDWTVLSRDDSRWSLTEQPGSLRVHALPGDTYQGTNTARNLFLMDNIPAGRSCPRACSRSGTRARTRTCRPTPPAACGRPRNLR
ncbi:hypothetical protein [Nonomuraea sp. C10]|uniref:beta-xylosidase family glycoside hydrolase n=1 Tax=Nonomuraea sp. C10 TaxID=2600577 RepID=UPI00164EF712|nr:hypothetical protein [Nonomuraea sp. C10]